MLYNNQLLKISEIQIYKIIKQFTLFLYIKTKSSIMASIYVTHGGGPMPIIYKQDHHQMYTQFAQIRARYPKPKAIIIFSAHWQEKQWTILDKDEPGLLFDYGGFPPESYQYKYPAKSTSAQRNEVIDSIAKSGIKVNRLNGNRGYDHGVFIPLMIMYPQANVPVIQISLLKSLDPQKHFQMGKALRELKKNGYLILGSGASVHGGFGQQKTFEFSQIFDKQLAEVCLKDSSQKQLLENLKNWRKLKYATQLHPREEHLIPLFVNLGAAQGKEREKWNLHLMGVVLSSYVFK